MATQVTQRTTAATREETGRPPTYYLDRIIRYTLLTLAGILFMLPFILSFLGTFKTPRELTTFPPSVFPDQWLLDSWIRAWNVEIQTRGGVWPAWLTPALPAALEGKIFPRWLFNSLWLALLKDVLQVFCSALGGYAFARMSFPGKNFLFAFMIATMAIPAWITLIPGFVFYARLGWVDTYWPLIIPQIAPAFGLLLMTQFMKALPRELEEAAYIDGASRFKTFYSIAIPLARPALITLAILQFQGVWNDYLGPLLYLRSTEKMTLTVGLAFFRSQYSTDWGAILVGAMFNAIPILIIFFIFNRYYIEGASMSGLAGQ
jgi:multiple sugar transport system permease protein